MECSRIKELLSEYIDGALDAQTRASVEDHVLTCSGCKEELASLSALVEELAALETVKAPADFLEKIHERMEPRSGLTAILRKLFVPLHIKIPMEMAAVATMVILVVSVLNVQQSGKQIARIPETATYERLDRKPEADYEAPVFKEETKAPEPAKPSAGERVLIAGKSAVESVKPQPDKEFETSLSAFEKAGAEQPVEKRSVIELALLLQTEVAGRGYVPEKAMAPVPPVEQDLKVGEEKRTVIPFSKRKVMKLHAEPTAEIKEDQPREESHGLPSQTWDRSALKDDLKLSRSDMENSFSRVKDLVRSVGGGILSIDDGTRTERSQSIDAEIPYSHYKEFCEKLSRLGTLRNFPPDLPDADLKTVRIRINLISSE